ncbi:E3 ubiquitin-protein ligase rnf213-alpha-like, partial [Mercenaria mercenaria]|uniref:E3 ubiquitin-protein ligase rnf213-alpha-like n=1 Tax=Mercenaria mercenaria TaxID=6596 RepID=UPI00234E6885
MRCSSSTCGAEGQGKFCPKCGSKMVEEEKTDIVVICNGKLDGKPCQSEIIPGQNFCTSCGTEVDQSLFNIQEERCSTGQTTAVKNDTESSVNAGSGQGELNEMKPVPQEVKKMEGDCENDAKSGKEGSQEGDKDRFQDENVPFKTKDQLEGMGQSGVQCSKEEGKVDNSLQDGNTTSSGASDLGEISGKSTENACGHVEMGPSAKNLSDDTDTSPGGTEVINGGNIPDDNESDSDVEMIEESEMNEDQEQEINKDSQTGNLVIVPSTGSKDLSSKLEQVRIENAQTGNINIINENAKTNEGDDKGTGTSDSEDDSKIDSDDSEIKNIEGASLSTDTNKVTGNVQGKRNKKQKKNKKKRKKDREAGIQQKEKTDDKSEKSQTEPIISKKSTSKSATDQINLEVIQQETAAESAKKEKQVEKTENVGQVFGTANSWKISQTSDTVKISAPKKSSLFQLNSSSADSSSTTTQTQAEEQMNEDRDDPMLGPDAEIDKDEDQTSSGTEDDTDEDSDTGNRQEECANGEQNGNLKKDLKHINDLEETDVDTGKSISRRQAKNKKKKQKKKKKENPPVNTGSTAGNKGVTTRSATRSSGEKFSVKFHVLTSENFQFDPAKHQVCIVMGNTEMGGWNKKDRQMKVERHIEGSIYELVYEAIIPVRLITSGNYFPYKYYIKRKDKDGKYEHYTRGGRTGEGVDRFLLIQQKYKSFDEWHQYDGFAEKEPDTVSMGKMKEFLSLKGDFTKHAEKAIFEFCPRLSDFEKAGPSDILKRMQMLFESLKRVYYQDARCWHDNYKGYLEFMGKNLIPAMFEQWKLDRDKSKLPKEEREQVLIGTFLLICTLDVLEISIQDTKLTQKLCKAMLISGNAVDNQCLDYQFVDKNFKERRKTLLEALLSVVKKLAGKTKDPSWLYLMPWVHFLSGKTVPFETQVVDVSHDSVKPVWWGIAEIENEVEFFKGKTGKWSIRFETILENLEPVFEIDYLMPRTFMTAVDLDDLEKVIQTGKIPVEVCLANLTYHVRVNRPNAYQDYYGSTYWFPTISLEEKKCCKCIKVLLKQLQATFYSETCMLTLWTMCYVIAASLFEECTRADRSELFYLSVQTLVHCLAMYDRCMTSKNENLTTSAKVPSLKQVLTSTTSKAVRWMGTWQYNWTTYMDNILTIWDLLFAPKELQSERVRDEWNKIIAEDLSEKLSLQVCKDSLLMKDFVQLYCQKVDKFNSKMQEVMSKAAFQ